MKYAMQKTLALLLSLVLTLGLLSVTASAVEYGNGDYRLSMDLMCSQDIDLIAVTVNGCNWTNQNDVFKVDSPDSAYVIVLTARSMNEINSGVRLNSQQLNAVPNPTIDNNNYTYT